MAKKGIVFAFLFVFASLCAGRTITVSLDGTGEFSTIQAAIDASINGDVVIVWPGLYRENINFTGKDIVLVSTEPENRHVVENTVIQGYGSCSVVTFAGFESESCELKGFKITGGNKADRGGGIIGNHCRATITNCIVTGNTAEIGGGISRCCGLISNCIISGNTAFYCGGGISDGWGSIVNCVIEGNKAMEFGGGIAWNASKFFGCIISGNTSKDESGQNYGGAAIVSMCNPFINCTICNNNALNGGACILLDPGSGGEFVNCIIWGNNSSATFSEPVGLLSVRNSCVEGGCSISEPYLWMVEWENNIELCPEFYDADAGDYRLQPWSPCIDAGVIDWYLGIPIAEYDIEGNGRVVDGDNDNVKWIDMGAYESPPCEEPVIGVSEFEFGFAAWAGGSYPREYEFTVRNRGGGELNWEILEDSQWLELSEVSGSCMSEGDTLILSVNADDLVEGDYECEMLIESKEAVNSPQVISVSMRVIDALEVPGEYSTIKEAVDVAYEGDVVFVADGVYAGEGNRDIELIDKSIIVISENGPESCVIDCQGSSEEWHKGFIFYGENQSVLDGLTIRNGYARYGGAIECAAFSSPTIIGCNFIGNRSSFRGGGINIYDSEATIRDCTFVNNTAEQKGGGVYMRFYDPALFRSVVENCRFLGNRSCYGGGLALCYNHTSNEFDTLRVDDCLFVGNYVTQFGGGLYGVGKGGELSIRNCEIRNNFAGTDYGDGGGAGLSLHIDGETELYNCLITDNLTCGVGGGLEMNCLPACVKNCTISFNVAVYGSGFYTAGETHLDNTLIWLNYSEADIEKQIISEVPSKTIYTHCSIDPLWLSTTYWDKSIGVDNGGNHYDSDLYPRFIDPYEGCFYLGADSPCIDAGCNAMVFEDLDGYGRPFDVPEVDNNGELPEFDMGAYEYSGRPAMKVSSNELAFYALEIGEILEEQSIELYTYVNEDISWEIMENCSWLSVSPVSSDMTAGTMKIRFRVDTEGLSGGDYCCVVVAASNETANPEEIIVVTLHIVQDCLEVPSEYDTIQNAIDNAYNGEVVRVADGIYRGDGNRDISFSGKRIMIKSADGPEGCIIDCQGSEEEYHRAFIFSQKENNSSVLDGFTIINGREWSGAGISCRVSNPLIRNCILKANISKGSFSGAIYCGGSRALIKDCIVENNQGERAGGICINGLCPTITDCTIRGNSGYDAGILCLYGWPTIANCNISGNQGVGISCDTVSTPLIENCVIQGNKTPSMGGGISCSPRSSPLIKNCTFAGNLALRGRGVGKGRVAPANYENFGIQDCIFWDGGDEIYEPDYQIISVTYSDVQGGWAGEGNIDLDPMFVMEGYWDPNGTEDNPDDDFWIEGDYRLLSASPCIDAGDPNYVTYVDDLDMDGFMRVMDGHCDGVSRLDMGAYEAPVPIDVQITPEVIYFESKGNFVFAHLQLPAVLQINEEDLEKVLLDGAVEALEIEWGQDDGMLTVKFDRAEVNAYLAETGALGQVQLGVEVVLVDRMRLWGVDTVTFLKGT